ncbi:MAG TPA: sugar phosphate isomerase/epimerase family protein [Planctomycetota bacterium]|nr:sugar phosphate isomerase/epimerase family protein [Planctomycetota bacterium]
MITALHTWSFRDVVKNDRSFNIFKMLDTAASLGFRGIEILTGMANCPPADIGSEEVAHLEKVLQHAESVGVRVLCFSTYNDFAYVKDEAWRQMNIAYIKKWLELSGKVGVPNIRMLTGYYNDLADRKHLEKLTEDGMRECVPLAEKFNVNMAVENHNTIFFSAEELLALADRLDSKRITFCPDPSNWCPKFFDADCPDAEREKVYRSVELLAPRATQSHLKLKGVDGETLRGFDLGRLLAIYKKAGYKGGVTFESIVDGDLVAPLQKAREVFDAARRKAGV